MEYLEAVILDEVLANAWPASLMQVLTRWQLRSSRGLDRRANSAWAIGDPDTDLEAAVEVCEDFYGRRAQPTPFRIGASSSAELVDLLRLRGYGELESHPLVAIADARAVSPRAVAGFEMAREALPSAPWFETYWSTEEGRMTEDPQASERARETMLLPGPEAVFVSALQSGEVVSVGEAVISRGWLVIQCIATREERRRSGGASAVLADLAALAAERSVDRLCLAVQERNHGARSLYDSIGFRVDHRCCYLISPVPPEAHRRPS